MRCKCCAADCAALSSTKWGRVLPAGSGSPRRCLAVTPRADGYGTRRWVLGPGATPYGGEGPVLTQPRAKPEPLRCLSHVSPHAGPGDGSITVWRMVDSGGDASARAGADSGGGASARAVRAWVALEAHAESVAGLAFLELPPGSCGGGGGGCGQGAPLPALVLASCSGGAGGICPAARWGAAGVTAWKVEQATQQPTSNGRLAHPPSDGRRRTVELNAAASGSLPVRMYLC